MLSLAIDTATEICAVALGAGGKLIGESTVKAGRSHLEMLLPEAYRLMEEHGLEIGDMDAFVAGTGPGTFTGLRVGIATARALAQAKGKPLFGFSTLEAIARGMAEGYPAKSSRQLLMPVIDAKRGQVFAQLFSLENSGAVREASDILCLKPEDLIAGLGELAKGPVAAAGNGVLAYRLLFDAAGQVEVLESGDRRHLVRAAYHLSGVADGVRKPKSLTEVLPVYVREPDADKTVLLRKREPWLR